MTARCSGQPHLSTESATDGEVGGTTSLLPVKAPVLVRKKEVALLMQAPLREEGEISHPRKDTGSSSRHDKIGHMTRSSEKPKSFEVAEHLADKPVPLPGGTAPY